ncbi:hypothetical protein STEG23_017240, partial [Scotinomys teguina]
MALKAGQGKEEEESRARQQKEKTPVRDEEKKPACDGRGHHVVEQDFIFRQLRSLLLLPQIYQYETRVDSLRDKAKTEQNQGFVSEYVFSERQRNMYLSKI